VGHERSRLFDAGIRNELLVYAPDGRLASGVDGVVVLLRHAGRDRAARLLQRPVVRRVATFAYRLVATNRRVLAPLDAARRVACDCDPDPHPGYRAAFVALCFALACGGAAGLGALLGRGAGVGAGGGASLGLLLPALLAAGPLPIVPFLKPGRRGEALAHLALQTAQAVWAALLAAAGLAVAFAVVLGVLFLAGMSLTWPAPLQLFAALYPFVWPTIAGVSVLAAVHVFVRGLRLRLGTLP